MKLLTLNTKSEFIKARSWWLISFSIIFNKLLLISNIFFLLVVVVVSHTKPSFILFIRHIFTLFTLFFFTEFYQKWNKFENNNNNNGCAWKIWMNIFYISLGSTHPRVELVLRTKPSGTAKTKRWMLHNVELCTVCLHIPKCYTASCHTTHIQMRVSSMCFFFFFGWWFRHRADDIVVALPSLWLRCVFTVHCSCIFSW